MAKLNEEAKPTIEIRIDKPGCRWKGRMRKPGDVIRTNEISGLPPLWRGRATVTDYGTGAANKTAQPDKGGR